MNIPVPRAADPLPVISADGSAALTAADTAVSLIKLRKCMALPAVSDWVVKNAYTLQFARRAPHFSGVIISEVLEQSTPLLLAEILSLLAKQTL